MIGKRLEYSDSRTGLHRIRRTSLIILGVEILIFFLFVMSGVKYGNLLKILIMSFAAIISGIIMYRLEENNRMLNDASRHDALTGLQNRMALEADAHKTDGRNTTAYMIDVNYFKEVNDHYGHAAGDALLRETSGILTQLFPGAHYYRYGGDEFLVLTHKPAVENYGAETYSLRSESCGVTILLSIGSAQGAPATYNDLFALISQADKALYTVKKRTHSPEYGGHERRRDDSYSHSQKAEICA